MKIFFDVDGVLIDGWHAKSERRRPWDLELEKDFGIDRRAFQHGFFEIPHGNFSSRMHGCVAGAYDLKEQLTDFLATLGYTGSIDALVGYWLEKDSNINNDVMDVLRRLRQRSHISLYLATGQEHYRAAYLWNELGFKSHFKDIFYGARLGELKGNPAFFRKINDALNITADEHPLFFDDQQEVVAVARSVGWDACVLESATDILNHPRLKELF